MWGIILAGGRGTRLWPITRGLSKQLIPVYDKPMIYYPISTLMLAGIQKIVIVTTPQDLRMFSDLLGDGRQFGVEFHYRAQGQPNGIGEAFLVAEDLVAGEKTCLILGDNLFHGPTLGRYLRQYNDVVGAQVFAYQVANPKEYGVVELDDEGNAISLEEKPVLPKSNYAVPGLYFYDETVLTKARQIKPSARGELEISDINQLFLNSHELRVQVLPRGTAWLDTGTVDALFDASSYVRAIELRQGRKIACLEEISYLNGWISKEDLSQLALSHVGSPYGNYLSQILAL
jgi:glucose-1-phosphate thymidylyltransferase